MQRFADALILGGLAAYLFVVLAVTDEQARELYQIAHRSHETDDEDQETPTTATDGGEQP